MRYRAAPLLAAAGLLGGISAANAHAHLRSATPAVDSTVAVPPSNVTIRFTEGIEPRFSSIAVRDSAGKRVDKGAAHTAPSDNALFSVGLAALPAGTHAVAWHATATDTHKTDGKFSFAVKPRS